MPVQLCCDFVDAYYDCGTSVRDSAGPARGACATGEEVEGHTHAIRREALTLKFEWKNLYCYSVCHGVLGVQDVGAEKRLRCVA